MKSAQPKQAAPPRANSAHVSSGGRSFPAVATIPMFESASSGQGVIQMELSDRDTQLLARFLTKYFPDSENPPQLFQNEVFDYLVANYDTFAEARRNVEAAILAVRREHEEDDGRGGEFDELPDVHHEATGMEGLEEDDRGRGLEEPVPVRRDPAENKEEFVDEDAGQHAFAGGAAGGQHELLDDGDEAFESALGEVDIEQLVFDSRRYKTLGEIYHAINDKPRKEKYRDIKANALEGVRGLDRKNKAEELPREVFTQASELTVTFLAANAKAIEIDGTHALPNKKNLEKAQTDIMQRCADGFKQLAGIDHRRPHGILRTPGAVVNKVDSAGTSHAMGTGYTTRTGLAGSREGEAAHTMSASVFLNAKYHLTFKNAFVAAHLATRMAGGKANDDNLTPLTGYFNQGSIRTPESKAERLMRGNKVMSYAARATYGRNSKNGSIVDFEEADLAMIPNSIHVRVDELGLRDGGDPTAIADWTVVKKTEFNDNLPVSLAAVYPSRVLA